MAQLPQNRNAVGPCRPNTDSTVTLAKSTAGNGKARLRSREDVGQIRGGMTPRRKAPPTPTVAMRTRMSLISSANHAVTKKLLIAAPPRNRDSTNNRPCNIGVCNLRFVMRRLTVELSCGPATPVRRHWIIRAGGRSRPRSGRPVSLSEWLDRLPDDTSDWTRPQRMVTSAHLHPDGSELTRVRRHSGSWRAAGVVGNRAFGTSGARCPTTAPRARP